MGLRDALLAGLARQLGRPEGLRGRIVGRGLNRGNGPAITAAAGATGLRPGQVALDAGFGGGLGLRLLLDRVSPGGRVHGVELSDTMLAQARRRHRGEIAEGRLVVHKGTLQQLPIEDGSVDGLITLNTVYFVDDVGAVFREIARVLSPGGCAVVGVADPEWMAGEPVSAHGFRVRPVAELVEGLQSVGLGVRDQQLEGSRGFHLLVATQQVG